MSENISYGKLAKELGKPARDSRSVLSWIEDGELHHVDEIQYLNFLHAHELHHDLQPGTLVDQETAAAIRRAAQQDPGEELPFEVQDALDELTAAAMTKMHTETTQALTAVLGGAGMAHATTATIAGLVDSIVGRCSPIVQSLAVDAYQMDRLNG